MLKLNLFIILGLCMQLFGCFSNPTISKHPFESTLSDLEFETLLDSSKLSAQNIEKAHLEFATQNNNNQEIAKAYARLARINEKFGRFDSSIHFYQLALEHRNLGKDSSRIFDSHLNLAKNYYYLNQPAKMESHLLKAEQIIVNQSDTTDLIRLYNSKGTFYILKNQTIKSKEAFKYSLTLLNSTKNSDIKSIVLENNGNIHHLLQESDSATYFYKLVIPLYKKEKRWSQLAHVYHNLAMVYWYMEQDDSARYYLEKGYNEIKKYGSKNDLQVCISNLANFWEETNPKKSNKYLFELLHLKDTVFNVSLSTKIADIEKSFEVKYEKEVNAKLTSELKRKNILRNAAITFSLLLLILAFYQYRLFRKRKRILSQEKELKDQKIEQLLKEGELKNLDSLFTGREEERKRIGQDLHDRLGSMLSTIKLHFSAIDEKIDTLKQENKKQYSKASTLLDEAVGEVRRIAHDLVSNTLVKNGLGAAIKELTETLEGAGKIKINFFENVSEARHEIETEITLYRIIQELISNILKHAEASKIDIHLSQTENSTTLIVEDNGIGFNTEENSLGIGLANVKQRVHSINGNLTIDSNVNSGTSIIIEI